MSDIVVVVVVVKCFKPEVDLAELVRLLDEFLQEHGFEVKEITFRIEEDRDETPKVALNTPR